MPALDPESKRILLQHARGAIARAIGLPAPQTPFASRLPTPELRLPVPDSRILATVRAGAFVTLRMRKGLRGCIGYPEQDRLLLEVVEGCAVSAALADPRFPPLSATEWRHATIEISVLGPIDLVRDVSEIEIGRHGLIVEMGDRRGLLLPQVAVEWAFTREDFVVHTCTKAGLPPDAWLRGARLFRFEADVFGETD